MESVLPIPTYSDLIIYYDLSSGIVSVFGRWCRENPEAVQKDSLIQIYAKIVAKVSKWITTHAQFAVLQIYHVHNKVFLMFSLVSF